MVQQASKEQERLQEMRGLFSWTDEQLYSLSPIAAREAAAGMPATPGSAQAAYNAAWEYYQRLSDERNAMLDC